MEPNMNKGLNRHNFLKAIGVLAASSIPGCASGTQGLKKQTPAQKQPNIVFIMADDLGYGDFGCYNKNSKIPTADEFESYSENQKDLHLTGEAGYEYRLLYTS
jgi:hypothetical protein